MGLFDKLFGRSKKSSVPEITPMPWDEKPSIYNHIRSHIDQSKPGLTEGGDKLPDEERFNSGSELRWAAGALDGVATHHMAPGEDDAVARQIAGLAITYCGEPTAENKLKLYRQIVEDKIVSMIDRIIEALLADKSLNHQRLFELAGSFATDSTDREPVKFGIAILGLFGQANLQEVFQTLGRHNEFTLFSAVALSNISDGGEEAVWTLARNVDGWGRIQTVERLCQTEDPRIKDWLIRDGFRNSIMYEYLACICARAGGLLVALSEETADRELFTAAGEIIEALIEGGPAEDIDCYEDGPAVIGMYLHHMEACSETLADFQHVNRIKEFLDNDGSDWAGRSEMGWTSDRRQEYRTVCDSILSRPEWRDRVQVGLNSQDEQEFHFANNAAKALGLETWDVHWKRLQEKPLDSSRWFYVTMLANDERIGAIVDAAKKHLDLAVIATGAADEMGLGPGFEHHSCLESVLQVLRKHPGRGTELILTGLKSPVVRNRNMATAALGAWGREAWPEAVHESLNEAAMIEPNEGTKEWMQKALAGESLDD